jgi:hypothetical protein
MRNAIIYITSLALFTMSCSRTPVLKQSQVQENKTKLVTNAQGRGTSFSIDFTRGNSFYFPMAAVWIENIDSSYIQTLYVSKSIATGVFKYGRSEKGRWISAPKRAPQALPYWSHKRGIAAEDGLFVPDKKTAVPDTYSGATPSVSFVLYTKSDSALPMQYRILLEINQNWDWNEYWTNDKYPDDEYYKYSCQPALVYEAVIDGGSAVGKYTMRPIGHSHYSGRDGKLYTDLKTLSTALHIADSIIVSVK